MLKLPVYSQVQKVHYQACSLFMQLLSIFQHPLASVFFFLFCRIPRYCCYIV